MIRPGLAATGAAAHKRDAKAWVMPDESGPHQRTWMAFGASAAIWGKKLLPEVQRNLALVANTISAYEPVAMLVRDHEVQLARPLLA